MDTNEGQIRLYSCALVVRNLSDNFPQVVGTHRACPERSRTEGVRRFYLKWPNPLVSKN